MFELMMAVFVVSVTLVAIVSLVGTSVSNTGFSRDRTQAAKLSNEAMEWVRAERDTNWLTFAQRGSVAGQTYCMKDLVWVTSTNCTQDTQRIEAAFWREVTLVYDPAVSQDEVHVRVVTSWEDSAGYHESRLSTILTSWRTN